MNRCQGCGCTAATKYVEYYQNIGMLIMRSMRSIKGNLCRNCAKKYFFELTGLTLLTGWWGMISFVINPFLILNNIIRYLGCLSLAAPTGQANPVQPHVQRAAVPASGPRPAPAGNAPQDLSGLTMYRNDIVLRLRGGETPADIAKFIAPRAGVAVPAALQFVEFVQKSQK